MIIRKAVAQDADDILAWRNDPATRAMSRTRQAIDPTAHAAWFGKVIDDARRTLLIGEQDGRKIGMVRLDHAATTEVSINLNPAFRGQGLAYPLLSLALEHADGMLEAEVHEENLASLKLFERAGFRQTHSQDGWRRYIRPAS